MAGQRGRVPGSGKNTKGITSGNEYVNARQMSANYFGAEGPKQSKPRKPAKPRQTFQEIPLKSKKRGK